MKQLTLILALLLLCTAGGRKKERIETPQAGAVLQMGFNEGPGVKDFSNAGNDGVVDGAAWSFANGITGGGMSFDGDNDSVNIVTILEDLSGTERGSWSVWINPVDSTPSATESVISFGMANGNEHISVLVLTTAQIRFAVADYGIVDFLLDTDSSVLSSGEWTHICVVQNGTEPKIYINGVEEPSSLSGGSDTTSWFDQTSSVNTGRIASRHFNDSNSAFFDGSIDEVCIYHRALSADEIKALYEQGKANKNP